MLGRSVLVASFFALLATCNPQYAPPDPLTTSTTSSSSAAASATGGGNGFAGGTMDVSTLLIPPCFSLSRSDTGHGVSRWSTCLQSSEFHSFQWHRHSLPFPDVSALPSCSLVGICSDISVCSTGLQHSVTQTTLQTPCTPLSGGFDSGLTEGTAFSIMITNDQTREL